MRQKVGREVSAVFYVILFVLGGVAIMWIAKGAIGLSGDALYVTLLLTPILIYAIATDRITALKGPGGLEATFARAAPSQLSQAERDPSPALAAAVAVDMSGMVPDLPAAGRLEFGTTLQTDIMNRILTAVRDVGELLEIDVKSGQAWWSTRLYLTAALAADYTRVRQIVFLKTSLPREHGFLGMATPRALVRVLARVHPDLDVLYRQAVAESRAQSLAGGTQEAEIQDVVQRVILGFPSANGGEPAIKHWVTEPALTDWLGAELSRPGVEWPDFPKVTPELLRRIMNCRAAFVALLRDGQCERVVDRGELAVRLAAIALSS